jgi:hypothetical protein
MVIASSGDKGVGLTFPQKTLPDAHIGHFRLGIPYAVHVGRGLAREVISADQNR